jgi:hypothetical protein
MTVSIGTGHSADYLTDSVGKGRESYYLDATTAGEAPGRWAGRGAAAMGLKGEVDADVMKAIFTDRADPRDPRFWDPATRDQADRLGNAPRAYRTAHEMTVEKLTEHGKLTPEQVARYREEAREEAGTSGQAERVLETKLGQAAGMLAEDVREVRGQCESAERQNVAFIDVVYSPPKSVTAARVAFERAELDAQRAAAGSTTPEERTYWEAEQQKFASLKNGVIDAIQAGADASLKVMEEKAGFARTGRTGAGADRWTNTQGFVVAQFHQTTSRDLDPQDHVHQAILNKTVCADGKVRSVDSKAIHGWKQAAGTAGERATFEKLADMGLGSAMRPDGNCRELVGVSEQTRDTFSERSKGVKFTKALQQKVDAYRERFQRDPSKYELDVMRRDASMATRRGKSHQGETKEQQLDRWEAQHRGQCGETLNTLANTLADGRKVVAAETFSPDAVKRKALAAVQEGRAAFSRSELYRQVELALPDRLGTDRAHAIVDKLTDEIIGEVERITGATPAETVPPELRLSNGQSVYANPKGPRYASNEHLEVEKRMVNAAQRGGRLAVDAGRVRAWITKNADWMTGSQKAALTNMMSQGSAVSVLVGPAGAGKSTVCGAAAKCWSDLAGGRVIGLAKSQRATEVLKDEGIDAKNIDQWLGAQERIVERRPVGDDTRWGIRSNDLVIVDESSMAETTAIDRVRGHVERAGARMNLAGDPAQLNAVGAGGVMKMLADGTAPTYTLTEKMRFREVDGTVREWAAKALFDMREGNVDGLREFERRGHLVDAGTREMAEGKVARGYVADTLRGLKSLAIVPTNEQAARVSAQIREKLVELGRVAQDGVQLGRDGNFAGVGDLVMARQNDWDTGLVNRARYEVKAVNEDGSLRVTREGTGKESTITAHYVNRNLQLGYAGTVHSGQGLSPDTVHGMDDGTMDVAGKYVTMSRGRLEATMNVVTQPEQAGEATGETHARHRQSVMAVVGQAYDRGREDTETALSQRAEDARQAGSMKTIHAWHEAGVRDICRARTERWLDDLHAEGKLSDRDRTSLAGDQATEALSRLLRAAEQAGHDPEQVLRGAVGERSTDGLNSVAQGLHARIAKVHGDDLEPAVDEMGASGPAGGSPEYQQHLAELREAADNRRRELGTETGQGAPTWAVESFGPVPADPLERADWEHRAGIVAAHREATGWDHETEPIGPSPGLQSTERRASWHAAHKALGYPEASPEEHELTEGALRNRVAAWERETGWFPKNVDDELRVTGEAAKAHAQEAALLDAKAEPVEAQAIASVVATASSVVDLHPSVRAALIDAAGRQLDQAVDARDRADVEYARAERLEQIRQGLEQVDEQRSAAIAQATETRAAAERAKNELSRRGVPLEVEDDRVTAEEWLAEHDRATKEDDGHRVIHEEDVADGTLSVPEAEARYSETGSSEDFERMADAVNRAESDERAEAEAQRGQAVEQDRVAEVDLPKGVPSLAEVEAEVVKAEAAASEIADRASLEAAHHQAEQSHRAEAEAAEAESREAAWHADDTASAQAQAEQVDASEMVR